MSKEKRDPGRSCPLVRCVGALSPRTFGGVLVAIAERCGLEGRALLDAADAQAVRVEYRGNTERALAAGVFGSPFYAFAGDLFWGQDRLDMLEEAIVRSAAGSLGRGPG